MVDHDLIAYVVETYDLPPRMTERLTKLAVSRLERHDIEDFGYQYGYVATLVDQYTRRRSPAGLASLDAPVSAADQRTLYCLIGRGDDVADTVEDVEHEGPDWLEDGLERAVEMVSERLSRPQKAFLTRLADQAVGTGEVVINPYVVADDIEGIRDRMDELSAKYQRRGEIILPKRPIKDVRFDPLWIRFAHRHLKGQALEFFRQHEDIYGGLTRSELARFDPGLYQALQTEGTIGYAIP